MPLVNRVELLVKATHKTIMCNYLSSNFTRKQINLILKFKNSHLWKQKCHEQATLTIFQEMWKHIRCPIKNIEMNSQ